MGKDFLKEETGPGKTGKGEKTVNRKMSPRTCVLLRHTQWISLFLSLVIFRRRTAQGRESYNHQIVPMTASWVDVPINSTF